METDFRLFGHARQILAALRLDDEAAAAVAGIFSAVSKNEVNVLREFDMMNEAEALCVAGELCCPGCEWEVTFNWWLREQRAAVLTSAPPHLAVLVQAFAQELLSAGWQLRVPAPEPGYVRQTAFV